MTINAARQNKRADKAYLKAVEELEKDRINEVKVIVKQVLEGIVTAHKQRKEADNKLTLLKQDLSDIRAGKIDKIKARHAKAKEERKWVPFEVEKLQTAFYSTQNPSLALGGTSTTNGGIGAFATSGTFSLNDGTVVNMTNAGNTK